MKNRKWLTYTLGTLLTLVVLAAVGAAGFRIGMTRNASFSRPAFARNFDGAPQPMQRNSQDNSGSQPAQDNSGPQSMQGNFRDNGWNQMRGDPRNQGFGNRGFNRGDDRRGGMPFFAPIFGLIHLIVLGLLLWVVYKLVKKSGWRLTRVQASPAPVVNETSNVEVGEKKASE